MGEPQEDVLDGTVPKLEEEFKDGMDFRGRRGGVVVRIATCGGGAVCGC